MSRQQATMNPSAAERDAPPAVRNLQGTAGPSDSSSWVPHQAALTDAVLPCGPLLRRRFDAVYRGGNSSPIRR